MIVSGQEWEAKAVYASNGRLERTVLWYEIGIHVQDLQVREKTIKLRLKFQSSEFPKKMIYYGGKANEVLKFDGKQTEAIFESLGIFWLTSLVRCINLDLGRLLSLKAALP